MRTRHSPTRGRTTELAVRLLVVSVTLVLGGLLPVAAASAAPRTTVATATVHTEDTTCPTNADPQLSGTIACETTTTVPSTPACPTSPALILTYSNGTITWQAYDYPIIAVGTTATLYVDGVAVSAAVVSGSCATTGPNSFSAQGVHANSVAGTNSFSLCLAPGGYQGVAVDSGFSDTNSVAFTVPSSQTCANPVTLASSTSPTTAAGSTAAGSGTGSGTSSSSGPLAFTGANVARLAVIALCALAVGLAITRLARRRRLG